MEPLASTADLESYSKGRILQSDPRALPALQGVSSAIRAYCGWHITPIVDEVLNLDGPGGTYLGLPTKHVRTILSVTESGQPLAETVDYQWSHDGSIRRVPRHRYWTDDYRAIKVQLEHGYPAEMVRELQQLTVVIAARELASPTGAILEAAGGQQIRWGSVNGAAPGIAILEHEYSTLDPYRIEYI